MVRPVPRQFVYVSILSNNAETLDGLQAYLRGAGVPCRCTRTIENLETVAPSRATAVVIFPDDFGEAEVIALVQQLRRSRPRVLALLITREPQKFRSVAEG